jgi:alkylation response protein AidB-like acyl-CoA dehydrogenase
MHQAGVEVRPIRNLAGSAEFCEVFFTGARTAADLVVGEVDGGWPIAMTVLGFERGTATLPHQMVFEREVDDLLALARRLGVSGDPVLRQRLADAWIGVRILAFNNARTLTAIMRGDGTLGPGASTAKLYWSHWHQELGELEMAVLGAAGMLYSYAESGEPMQRSFLSSRAETIYGGASQIQRNTIGERVLGLPREPRP